MNFCGHQKQSKCLWGFCVEFNFDYRRCRKSAWPEAHKQWWDRSQRHKYVFGLNYIIFVMLQNCSAGWPCVFSAVSHWLMASAGVMKWFASQELEGWIFSSIANVCLNRDSCCVPDVLNSKMSNLLQGKAQWYASQSQNVFMKELKKQLFDITQQWQHPWG